MERLCAYWADPVSYGDDDCGYGDLVAVSVLQESERSLAVPRRCAMHARCAIATACAIENDLRSLVRLECAETALSVGLHDVGVLSEEEWRRPATSCSSPTGCAPTGPFGSPANRRIPLRRWRKPSSAPCAI